MKSFFRNVCAGLFGGIILFGTVGTTWGETATEGGIAETTTEAVSPEIPPNVEKTEPSPPKENVVAKEEGEDSAAGNSEAEEQVRIQNVRMDAVETLQIPEVLQEEAAIHAQEFVDLFCRNVTLQKRTAFLEAETKRLHGMCAEGGSLRRLLANMTILDDVDFPELKEMEKPLAQMMARGMTPVTGAGKETVQSLRGEVASQRKIWQKLRQELEERQFLLFEIESNRHIVAQLASMLSVDKRWFWLLGVVAFGLLVLASFHERRHEIRRWLNGGRARQMGLSKILAGCFVGLVLMTVLSFVMGEFLYRMMLDVTFRTTSPRRIHVQLMEREQKTFRDWEPLEIRAKEAWGEEKKAWTSLATKNMANSKEILQQWNAWRESVGEMVVQLALLKEIQGEIEADRQKLQAINGKLTSISGETLQYLRWKHLLRFLLGIGLTGMTFLGIAYYWSEVQGRRRMIANRCPHCLAEGELVPCDEHGNVAETELPRDFVVCKKVVSEVPYEECGYRFERSLQPRTKLSFPTLGIPQVGKTHWLTMLYWEVLKGYYPHLGISCIPSSVTQEMERRVDEIMNIRVGTAATQRDRIPLPLVLKYRDKDWLGRTELLANIFDYSGEITTDTSLDDFRRQRALLSDGFFFFLDPTYPWRPQAEALRRFRKDLRELKGLDPKESLHLPIAICLTKIDLLPLVDALGDSEAEAMKFYEELGRIDPTGMALNKRIIEARSEVTDVLRQKIWPDWDVEKQVNDLFGGRHMFFPLTPVGLDGAGEADLRLRTIAPFGLIEPLAWLLEMSGFPTLDK
ncbi:MAG: hypothetical protein Q4D62_06010 [Planctomycetia bacterium]|nr:hypothetical protein [Planctomycetia bacterium]